MDPENTTNTDNQNTENDPAQEPETDYESKYQAQRKVNKDLERKLNDTRKQADKVNDLESQLAALQGKQAEYDQAKHEQEISDKALAKANQRILNSEVRVAAAGRLADPNDALKFMDLSHYTVGDDGEVDQESINAGIDELLASKPYLAKGGKPTGPTIIPPSGARDGDRHANQLKREDLKTMTPKQIVEAQNKGLLNDLLGRNK
jgi:flagellar biosynthesis GTPase FlhF